VGEDREEEPTRLVTGRSRLLLWAPVALLLAYEFYLSSRSVLPNVFFFPQADKVAHAGYFGLMGGCAVRAARWAECWSRKRTFWTILLAAFVYGCLDEFHQSFVPGRDVEAGDVAADAFGGLMAVLTAERLWIVLGFERRPPAS
jgi:VanZ family protein